MQSKDQTRAFYYQASASPLGGQLQLPFSRPIPTHGSATLSAAGGFSSARAEAISVENIVSCKSASTQVSGRESTSDNEFTTLVTTVIEGLSILEIVTAERIVAQLSVAVPTNNGPWRISTGGSRFEGLRVGGEYLNPKLLKTACDPAAYGRIGQKQAEKLTERENEHLWEWAIKRYDWMKCEPEPCAASLCSLLETVLPGSPETHRGHLIQIPDFGRIFLGELLILPGSVQLSMVRAELGCNVHGTVNAAYAGSGGSMIPPGIL